MTALVLLSLLACRSPDIGVYQIQKRLAVTAALVDVGDVPVGATHDFTLQLDSVAGGDIEVRNVSVLDVQGSFFVWDGVLPLVPADESAFLGLTYAPEAAGYHTSRVTIVSESETSQIEVTVRGRGIAATGEVWPAVIDFGPVAVGDSATESVTVYNSSDLPIDIAAFEVGAPFSVATSAPLTIAPGQDADIDVVFSPTDTNQATDVIEFDAGDFLELPSVDLRCNACSIGLPGLYDTDGDGFSACADDCDDTDPTVFPTATEVFDAIDQDCDSLVDEGTEGYDDDGDGYAEIEGDCNDNDPTVGPISTEDPNNGVDDDCDGVVDLGSADDDGDGYSPSGGDCNDNDATVHPGATELPDGMDQDCDGVVDENTVRYDDDGDGYCEASSCTNSAHQPGDCDDTSSTSELFHPGAIEIADWRDNDCDGTVDEGTDHDDSDGDGYSEVGGDCDDTNAAVGPSSSEVPGNGIDDDCDPSTSD